MEQSKVTLPEKGRGWNLFKIFIKLILTLELSNRSKRLILIFLVVLMFRFIEKYNYIINYVQYI